MAQLNSYQQARLDQARQALVASQAAGSDPMSLAQQVGALQWNIAEVLKLVGELAGNA